MKEIMGNIKNKSLNPVIKKLHIKNSSLYLMILPAFLLVFVFSYIPMLGIVIAFKEYKPWIGVFKSPWVGLDQFKMMFTYPGVGQIIWNTLYISVMKIVIGFIVPIIFALLLNEVRSVAYKRTIQTLVYLPYFLSWVILGGVLTDLLSVNTGMVNNILKAIGMNPIMFLQDGDWFRFTVVVSDVWKGFGFSTIVYIAAITGISPSLYEAATVDGANKWKQALYITIPSILPIAAVVLTLSLGNILNAGFDQIFNLYSPLVYGKGDIIDTFVYRTGMIDNSYSFSTAVGLFKSVISFMLITMTYKITYKYGNYRIF